MATTADGALYRLLAWLSPSFPVGAYSYSHALEAAVEAGLVTSRAALVDWLDALLAHGAPRSDAILLAEAWDAVTAGEAARVAAVAELADALRPTRELALEASAQGAAFMQVLRGAWAPAGLEAWDTRDLAYPVAVGLAGALAGIARRDCAFAYLHAFAANLVSAAVRLVPLGQTDGQAAIAAVEGAVGAAADAAMAAGLDDIGGATPAVDVLSMRHETQYTRLFRS